MAPSKLGTLTWFLRRPRLYPELIRRAIRSIKGRPSVENTRAQAEQWCEAHAVDTPEALIRLTGSAPETPIREQFADVFRTAEATARACPVEMGGPGNLDLLYALAEHVQAERVVETGVAYGWSSLALLLSVRHRDGATVISTDMPYRGRDNDGYVGCVVPPELANRWTLIRRPDRDALPKALRSVGSIDLCHYDSDKSYVGRSWAYPRLFRALRAGGCFISDDVGDNLAFHDFCRTIGVTPVIVRTPVESIVKYVGVFLKDRSMRV